MGSIRVPPGGLLLRALGRPALPTYLPGYLPTYYLLTYYLHTYPPTYLPTHLVPTYLPVLRSGGYRRVGLTDRLID